MTPTPDASTQATGNEATETRLRALQEAFDRASAAIERIEQSGGGKGAEEFESKRAAIVARAKSEPVFFVSTPRQADDVTPEAKTLREHLERTDFAWRAVRELRAAVSQRTDLAREVLLLNGYFYSHDPNLAFALVSQVRPTDLFDTQKLWIQRGSALMQAERGSGGYVYLDGPEKGDRVRLLHLDRLSSEPPAGQPLHRDFRDLRARLFFEQARIRHVNAANIIADLRYGPHWIPTLLRSEGTLLHLETEAVPPAIADELAVVRERLGRKAQAVSALRQAMRDMIDEALPFDEPKTEIGQEDGKLRNEWINAYRTGRTSFTYNDDRYYVFDSAGRPRIPQVCIDFMVDVFERASGSWWRPRSDGIRERTVGGLDMSEFNRSLLRQTSYFLRLARERNDLFEVRGFAESERIELGYKDRFFRWLERNAREFEAGDIIVIRGLTPWDPVEEHTHTFFIYETDPLTGIPIAIAGNAGPANLWSWETEARRTPHRTVRSRIRPRLEWLETFIATDGSTTLVPPALVSGKR